MYEALENEVLRERLRRVRAQKAELANEVLIFLKGGGVERLREALAKAQKED